MFRNLQAITALLIGIFFFYGANGLLTTVLALKSQLAGFAPGLIGLLASGYYLGFILACMTGKHLIVNSGHIRSFAAFASLATISVLLHPLVVEPIVWILLRVLSGYCHAMLIIVGETWLNAVTPANSRSSVFSFYRIVELTSITLAQLSLWFVSIETSTLFLLIAISFSLAIFPITQFRSKSPGIVKTPGLNLRKLIDVSPLAMAGTFSLGLSMGAFWGLSPVFLQNNNYEPHVIGWFISMAIIGGACLQWPLGRLSDKIDRRKVIILASVTTSIIALLFSIFASTHFAIMLALVFLFGGFSIPLYAICISHAYDFSDPGEFVEVSGGLLLFYGIGAVIGPALISLLMGYFGERFLFLTIALIMLILAIYGARWLRLGTKLSPDMKNRFVNVATTDDIFQLDPRKQDPEEKRGD